VTNNSAAGGLGWMITSSHAAEAAAAAVAAVAAVAQR